MEYIKGHMLIFYNNKKLSVKWWECLYNNHLKTKKHKMMIKLIERMSK